MTTEQTADTFRKIDNLAEEARRSLQAGDERVVARGLLSSIQDRAQAGLRETLAKLEAFDGLLAASRELLALCQAELHGTIGPEHEEVVAVRAAIAKALK